MSDETENIVLENLRRIRAQLDKIESVLEQHTEQFSELRRSIATVRRDQAAPMPKASRCRAIDSTVLSND